MSLNIFPDSLEPPERCLCGHSKAEHYNARSTKGKSPCHHMARWDIRCVCRNYNPPVKP